MRGEHDPQGSIFYAIQLEDLVPAEHPLRAIRELANQQLKSLSRRFETAYSKVGRPSIPPEMLIKASLLQALYSIRSERQLCEQITYNFLYRWFVGLKPDDRVWDPTTFTQNRRRFAEHGLMQAFFESTVVEAIRRKATSEEHFSVDGTLIQSWASMKSVRRREEEKDPRDGDSNRWVDWHGEKRSNETHESKTDPEAMLMRKGNGQETKLYHSMHALMENRHGILMNIDMAEARPRAERQRAIAMLERVKRRFGITPKTLAADKGYDDGRFLHEVEHGLGIEPHVPTRAGRIVANDDAGFARHLARHREKLQGFRKSQIHRRRIEEIFAWPKDVALMRRTRFVGRWKSQIHAYLGGAAYNLLRLTKLAAA
jgi:transposase